MYGGLGGKEGSSSNACKILLSWTQLDVGRHGQLLAVEAVLCPIRVDVAEGREVWELLELGRVGLLEMICFAGLPLSRFAGTAVSPRMPVLGILARTRILFAEL